MRSFLIEMSYYGNEIKEGEGGSEGCTALGENKVKHIRYKILVKKAQRKRERLRK